MVDGDGVDDDGDEDGEEIPLPGVESRTNLTPETKIVVAAELRIADEPSLRGQRISPLYEGVCERGGRDEAGVAQSTWWRAQGVGAPPGHSWPSWPPSSGSKAQVASFHEIFA